MSEPDPTWERWYAVIPVTVDAYREEEIRNGKMSYSVALQWVERLFVPEHDDEEGEIVPGHWKYRLPQAPVSP